MATLTNTPVASPAMETTTPPGGGDAPSMAGNGNTFGPTGTFQPTGTFEPTFFGETYSPTSLMESPAFLLSDGADSPVLAPATEADLPPDAAASSPTVSYFSGPGDDASPSFVSGENALEEAAAAASSKAGPPAAVSGGAVAAIVVGIVLGIGLGMYVMHRRSRNSNLRETNWSIEDDDDDDNSNNNRNGGRDGLWNLQRNRILD